MIRLAVLTCSKAGAFQRSGCASRMGAILPGSISRGIIKSESRPLPLMIAFGPGADRALVTILHGRPNSHGSATAGQRVADDQDAGPTFSGSCRTRWYCPRRQARQSASAGSQAQALRRASARSKASEDPIFIDFFKNCQRTGTSTSSPVCLRTLSSCRVSTHSSRAAVSPQRPPQR